MARSKNRKADGVTAGKKMAGLSVAPAAAQPAIKAMLGPLSASRFAVATF
jgi:hypothetical protein